MQAERIDERRKKVLEKIVRFYIDSAEPVSSKAVSDEMELSSATVRNIMSDLETSGLIRQPYISAGRIPTRKGYQFYVDLLMEPEDISPKERECIESIYQLELESSLEDIIEESSHILSYISSLAAVAMFPKDNEDRLYFEGAYHMLEQPEFRDSGRTRSLFKTLEEKEVFLNIFREDLYAPETKVRIGAENGPAILNQCSTITANYRIAEDVTGVVGILGPTRMEYSKLVPMVDYLARTMSDFLKKIL